MEATPQKSTVSVTLGFLCRNLCYSLPLFLQTQHTPGLSVPTTTGIWLIGLEPTPGVKHGNVGAFTEHSRSVLLFVHRDGHLDFHTALNDALSEMQPASSPSTTHTLAIPDPRTHEAVTSETMCDTKAAVFVFVKTAVDWNHLVNAAAVYAQSEKSFKSQNQ